MQSDSLPLKPLQELISQARPIDQSAPRQNKIAHSVKAKRREEQFLAYLINLEIRPHNRTIKQREIIQPILHKQLHDDIQITHIVKRVLEGLSQKRL